MIIRMIAPTALLLLGTAVIESRAASGSSAGPLPAADAAVSPGERSVELGGCPVDVCAFDLRYKRRFQGLRVKVTVCERDGGPVGAGWRVCFELYPPGQPPIEVCTGTRKRGQVRVKFEDLNCGDVYDVCLSRIQDLRGEECTPGEPTCDRRIIPCVGP